MLDDLSLSVLGGKAIVYPEKPFDTRYLESDG